MKQLNEISWNVDEPTYRKDTALSYSILSKYEREGFESLFGPVTKTSSLTYGSVVDTLITDGIDAYNNKYCALRLNSSTVVQSILVSLYKETKAESLYDIPMNVVVDLAHNVHFGGKWKDQVIYDRLVNAYTNVDYTGIVHTLQQNPDKEIIDESVEYEAFQATQALHTSDSTKWYFDIDDDFTKRYYQLKFKGTIDGIDYRCMADLIIVLPYEKKIIPCDLKTTGHPEIYFWDSFHKWYYFYQAKLYWNIIRQNLDKDEYFKDFKLEPYKFIVVNKQSLNPMVYTYDQLEMADYSYQGITYRNPSIVGKELRELLDNRQKEMNKEKVMKALESIKNNLDDIKEAIKEHKEVDNNQAFDLQLLARAVALSYKTNRSDLSSDKLALNIKEMAKGIKFKILLNWLDTSPLESIKAFRKRPLQEQQQMLEQAVTKYNQDIIDILDQKYAK